MQNLVSYIGDLQSVCYDFGARNSIVNDFETEVLEGRTTFSRSDLYSDIDSYNIGTGYLTVYDENVER